MYRPMIVASDTALRGVQSRLLGGVLTALLTLCCIAFVLTSPGITMAVTFAFTIGTYSLAASIALLMSARQEEIVHQLSSSELPDTTAPHLPHHSQQHALLHHGARQQDCRHDLHAKDQVEEHALVPSCARSSTDGRL